MCCGMPKRDIQLTMRACAHELADVSFRGMASGHLVNRSITVRRCVYPCDGGSGPTNPHGCDQIGALILQNHLVMTWRVGVFWLFGIGHMCESIHQPSTIFCRFFHTNLREIRRRVARIPGCTRL